MPRETKKSAPKTLSRKKKPSVPKTLSFDKGTSPVEATRIINNAVDDMLSRAFASRLGRSWYNEQGIAKRKLYDTLGYITDLTFKDFYARFKRGDIAKRIIQAPVSATWRLPPIISEVRTNSTKKGEQTVFEKAWYDLVKNKNVLHYLARADLISGIGRYGILLMGFSGTEELNQEVPSSTSRKLLFLMPYTEENSTIKKWVTDTQNERYGKPEQYAINMQVFASENNKRSTEVHYSRVLHIAEDVTENDTLGTPRLEAIFNRLQDLELVAGGSGEMFWRGALPGFNFKLDSDADATSIDTDDLKNQMSEYIHGLSRYFRTQGMDIQSLAPQVADPTNHADLQIKLISATTGIPKRILEGSERGELASSQDETNWLSIIDARRENYVEPMILRPFIQRLIDYGVLPKPKDGFNISWPSLFSPNAKDRAEIAAKKTDTLVKYVAADGVEMIIPPEIFLRDFLEYEDESITEIIELVKQLMLEKEAEEEEEEEEEEFDIPEKKEEEEEEEKDTTNKK